METYGAISKVVKEWGNLFKNKKIWIPVLILLGMMIIGWGVYASLIESNQEVDSMSEDMDGDENISDEEELDEKVVNDPVRKDIIVFASNDYDDGHQFISEFHDFYNDTLGWGRIASANYDVQKSKANEILAVLEGVEVHNENLKKDFEQIVFYAEKVTQSNDKESMKKLHRLFHDLDIYFNGYSYNQTFGITNFKGE